MIQYVRINLAVKSTQKGHVLRLKKNIKKDKQGKGKIMAAKKVMPEDHNTLESPQGAKLLQADGHPKVKVAAQELVEKARALLLKKKPDFPRAYDLIQHAAGLGNAEAEYAIGTWLLHGKHMDKDLKGAAAWLTKAAEKKYPPAMYDLALSYEVGTGVRKNLKRAFHLYLEAALYGDKEAYCEVGRCYYWGIGTTIDKKIGQLWFDRAESLGTLRKDN